jgi:hypothetical protein
VSFSQVRAFAEFDPNNPTQSSILSESAAAQVTRYSDDEENTTNQGSKHFGFFPTSLWPPGKSLPSVASSNSDSISSYSETNVDDATSVNQSGSNPLLANHSDNNILASVRQASPTELKNAQHEGQHLIHDIPHDLQRHESATDLKRDSKQGDDAEDHEN